MYLEFIDCLFSMVLFKDPISMSDKVLGSAESPVVQGENKGYKTHRSINTWLRCAVTPMLETFSYAGNIKEDIIQKMLLACCLKNEQEISVSPTGTI